MIRLKDVLKTENDPPEEKPAPKWTAPLVIKQLEGLHPADEWAFFVELRVGTGYGKDSQQSFDAYAIHYMKGKRNVTRCYEIKVSRSDFFSEIKKPLKRRAGLRLSHEFYFVTPKGLVKIEEVPAECGLIEVEENGKIEVTIEAPYREALPTWQFLATISRRLDASRRLEQEFEEKVRSALYEREAITRSCLERHLEKWRKHNIGSREIPDKILDAMEDLKLEVEDSMQRNRKW